MSLIACLLLAVGCEPNGSPGQSRDNQSDRRSAEPTTPGSVFVATAAAAGQPDPATETRRVTIGAYNVLNFFDSFDDPYNEDEVMRPKTGQSLSRLADLIKATDADFLGVTEMENEGALAAFVADYLPNSGYRYVHVNHRIGMRGINNGFISRLRPGPITIWRWAELEVPDARRQWPFARDLLEVKLEPIEGRPLSVFTVHFKSKRTVDDDDPQSAKWRLAEALAVREIVRKRLADDPDAWIAVVGDFNDTPDSPTIKALTEPADGRKVLIDLIGAEADEPPVTYLRSPYRSQIDYIMVTPGLAACYVPGSARVVTMANMMQASDHTPIVASFDLPVAAPLLP